MLFRALVWAPVRSRPWRSLATVIGIAAGVAAFVATLIASRSAVSSLRDDTALGGELVRIEAPGGIDDSALALLRPLTQGAQLLPRMDEWVLEQNSRSVLRLYGIDALLDPRLLQGPKDWRPTSEQIEATWQGRGVWVSQELPTALTERNELQLLVRGIPRTVPVIGHFPLRSPDDPLRSAVIGDLALVESLFAPGRRLDSVDLVPRKGWTAEQVQESALACVPQPLRVVSSADLERERRAMVRSLEFNLLSLSGISLLVGAVLVATALASAVVERRKLLALCVSLGATRRQLVATLLGEALLYGSLGGALGAIGGALAAHALAPTMRSSVETVLGALPESGVRIEAGLVLAGVAMGIAAALLASILPLFEIVRTPPLQSLRRAQQQPLSARARLGSLLLAGLLVWSALQLMHVPSPDGLPLSGLGASIALLLALVAVQGPLIDALGRSALRMPGLLARMPSLRLSASALAAGRRRAAWASAAVGMSVALSISIAAMVLSFRTSVETWAREGLLADLALRPVATAGGVPLGELDAGILAECQSLYGPEHVHPFHREPARVGGRSITLGGGDLAVVARRGGVAYRDGRDSREVLQRAHTLGRVLINEPLATWTGLREGDSIRIETDAGVLEKTIEGVFVDYGDSQGLVITERAEFLRLFPRSLPRTIDIYLDDPTSADAERERVLAVLRTRFAVEVLTRTQLLDRILSVFDRTFAITRALELVSAIVAVIAVLTVLYALLAERAGDLALLWSLGATRAELFAQILLQAAWIGLLGAVLGILTGLAIGVVLVDVVNLQSFGWTIRYQQPFETCVRMLVLVVVFAGIAGALPALRVLASPAARILREEGT